MYLQNRGNNSAQSLQETEAKKLPHFAQKFRKSSAKVRHDEVGFISVSQAAKHFGVNVSTITRWCESGKLLAIPKEYGQKSTWRISQASIELTKATQDIEVKEKKSLTITSREHDTYFDDWIKAMRGGTLTGKPFSPRTVEDYRYYMKAYFELRQWISKEGLLKALNSIPVHQVSKRQHCYKAIVCFSRYLISIGAMNEAFINEVKPLSPKRHIPVKRKRISEDEIKCLFEVCNNAEDKLLLALLYYTGMRASEACALKWQDINLSEGFLTIHRGKGNKKRLIGLVSALAQILKGYEHDSTAFVLKDKNRKQMTRQGIYARIERLGKVSKVDICPHALRRAFVTINANKGRPLNILQLACGHSDIRTTMNYCLTNEKEIIELMQGW